MSRRKKHSGGGRPTAKAQPVAAARRPEDSPEAARAATRPDVCAGAGTPESAEPVAGTAPVPPWMFALLALLLYLGEVYLMNHGADLMGKTGRFSPLLYDPYVTHESLVKANPATEGDVRGKGQLVFERNCQQCHQATGLGVAGQFPPLAGSEWVLAEGPNRVIRNVLNGVNGPFTVKGVQYNNNMFAFRDLLSDQDVAAVLTFIRSEWGNNAPPVKPDQVKKIRDATADRSTPWTETELLKIPEKD